MSGFDPRSQWRSIDDLPEYGERPIRQWVHVEGTCEHHGSIWRREYIGEAIIRCQDAEDGRQGYRSIDLDAIEERGDMDLGTGLVTHWMGVSFPPVPAKATDHPTSGTA